MGYLKRRVLWGIATAVLVPGLGMCQLTTGTLEGTLRDPRNQPLAGTSLVVSGALKFSEVIHSNPRGKFSASLPYGLYWVSTGVGRGDPSASVAVYVAPLQTVHLNLVIGPEGLRAKEPEAGISGPWADSTRARVYPAGFSLQGLLSSREPASDAWPLNLTGLNDNRVALESQGAASWTTTQYKLLGMDATDSYQPGHPVILPDLQEMDSVVLRSGMTQTTSNSYGTEVGFFLSQPGTAWHIALFTSETSSALAASNLPPAADRGAVEQDWHYQWLTRDGFEASGPIKSRADIYAAGTIQWSNQTVPLEPAGNDQGSRLMFGNFRGRFRASARDQLDGLFSGSRITLSNWGQPMGLEALVGRRMAPPLLPGGFPDQTEVDHMDFLQGGWSHWFSEGSGLGILQVRYGYSSAHMDGEAPPEGVFGSHESKIELLTGQVTGAPPLANFAVRTRQGLEGAWQPSALEIAGGHHQIILGAGWKSSAPLNRFTIPSDLNLITVGGSPAFVVEFNTPLQSRSIMRTFSSFVADHINLARGLWLDLGVMGDFSRGMVPAQGSGGGNFAPPRTLVAQADSIGWNSVSPRASFAWQVRGLDRLVLTGGYFRLYAPLAGRYLDFGNPNSLSGNEYQWVDRNSDGQFQIGEEGPLLMRFGGAYSSISPTLRRPYADQFHAGARASLGRLRFASLSMFRRDDQQRVAALDVGIPSQAFTPVTILDPLTHLPLTVYQQNPATFGQDRYLLTNPPGLRTFNEGLTAELGFGWRALMVHMSFTAEKSFGPNNPGNSILENDPGVAGALYLDPNTAINAAGRNYLDSGYIGKAQATYRLPSSWGGIEVASTVDYLGGLGFEGEVLVTGLAQGPFLVLGAAGYRADYVANWNLRLLREFPLPLGRLAASAEILNVLNAGHIVQESGFAPNPRSPIAFQEPRWALLQLRYEF
jgi:hypothetical protein